jgi:hypothetical protein
MKILSLILSINNLKKKTWRRTYRMQAEKQTRWHEEEP